MQSLDDIRKANLCSGCGICEAMSGHDVVKMEFDQNGFLRPKTFFPNSVPWPQIKQICPGIFLKQDGNDRASTQEKLWGPVKGAFKGYALDNEIRWRGSSGGALSATLIYLLESGQADFASQIRMGDSDPLNTFVQKSYNRQDVLQCAGSLYIPTAPLTGLLDALQLSSQKFVLVGKPCDMAAVRAFLRIHPEFDSRIIALISFFCAGIPNKFATEDLIAKLGVKKDQVKTFHYRGRGWPGRATATNMAGNGFSMSYSDSWGKVLSKRIQFRCKICPDGIGEFADIVFGDGWSTKNGYPDFEEGPGWSLILARTLRGKQILEGAIAKQYLNTTTFDLQDLSDIQPSQKNRRQAIAHRVFALKLLQLPSPTFLGFYLFENARKTGLFHFLKSFFGMIRRIVFASHSQ